MRNLSKIILGLGFLIVVVGFSFLATGSNEGKAVKKDYKIEVLEHDRIIIIEQIRDPEDIMERRAGDPDGFRSSVEIFKEAIKEVEKEYNIYSACSILEPGYPPVFGSWTKALILFVGPKVR